MGLQEVEGGAAHRLGKRPLALFRDTGTNPGSREISDERLTDPNVRI
jgi:hypothetical protein